MFCGARVSTPRAKTSVEPAGGCHTPAQHSRFRQSGRSVSSRKRWRAARVCPRDLDGALRRDASETALQRRGRGTARLSRFRPGLNAIVPVQSTHRGCSLEVLAVSGAHLEPRTKTRCRAGGPAWPTDRTGTVSASRPSHRHTRPDSRRSSSRDSCEETPVIAHIATAPSAFAFLDVQHVHVPPNVGGTWSSNPGEPGSPRHLMLSRARHDVRNGGNAHDKATTFLRMEGGPGSLSLVAGFFALGESWLRYGPLRPFPRRHCACNCGPGPLPRSLCPRITGHFLFSALIVADADPSVFSGSSGHIGGCCLDPVAVSSLAAMTSPTPGRFP